MEKAAFLFRSFRGAGRKAEVAGSRQGRPEKRNRTRIGKTDADLEELFENLCCPRQARNLLASSKHVLDIRRLSDEYRSRPAAHLS